MHILLPLSSFPAFPVARLFFSALILLTDFLPNLNSLEQPCGPYYSYFLSPLGPHKGNRSTQLPVAKKVSTSANGEQGL
jgi:hypothetical protein